MCSPEELFSARLDGRQLSDEEAIEVRKWIAADVRNAARAVELSNLHSLLDESLSILSIGMSDVLPEQEAKQLLDKALQGMELVKSRQAKASPVGLTSYTITWISLAVAASLLLVVGSLLYYSDDPQLASNDTATTPLAPPAPIEARTYSPSEGTAIIENQQVDDPDVSPIALIDTRIGDIWDSSPPIQGTGVLSGTVYQLQKGLVRVRMPSGTTVVCEAPCVFSFADTEHLNLMNGRVAIETSQAHDITVHTPEETIRDIGTEFGVGLGPDRRLVVAVYNGEVVVGDEGEKQVRLPRGMVGDFATGTVKSHTASRTISDDRQFVRDSEIELIEEARHGSQEAAQLLEWYRRRRIGGLVAHATFSNPVRGHLTSVGMHPPRADGDVRMNYKRNVEGVYIGSGGAVFLDVMIAKGGRAASTGLLNPSELVGADATEMWLTWKTQSLSPMTGRFAGLSLMYGDVDRNEESVIFGATDDSDKFVIATYIGSKRERHLFSKSTQSQSFQSGTIDQGVHTWVVCISFQEGNDRIRTWLDCPLDRVDVTPPSMDVTANDVQFDRIRLANAKDAPAWFYADVVLARSLDSIKECLIPPEPPAPAISH
ncbi:FecR domain-containing protein [Aeoliella mucimassa]|uniref:FecR protein n=1 Tax=Aeoliella mucimassa TaxID=2527972 RepID=A0A518APQ3_9BACT|nr:FecR domain-containing protein [Aeoliella mucimassa]QDU56709.1 FecR protein [Aeoliella mucimassa]